MTTLAPRLVGGHQDMPSDSHEADAMTIAESDQIRWSSRREIHTLPADSARLPGRLDHLPERAHISFWVQPFGKWP